VKRLKVGVRRHGPAALPHKNRGRKPKHALPETTRRLIVEVASGPYRGASCPHISELLAQGHDILVSPRTVHRVLAASSLNRARRRSPRRHRTRPRMPQEGLLVQCDASLHHWLEDRGLQCSLLGAVDDATSKILGLVFRPQEDLRGYLQLMHDVISRHGVPGAARGRAVERMGRQLQRGILALGGLLLFPGIGRGVLAGPVRARAPTTKQGGPSRHAGRQRASPEKV